MAHLMKQCAGARASLLTHHQTCHSKHTSLNLLMAIEKSEVVFKCSHCSFLARSRSGFQHRDQAVARDNKIIGAMKEVLRRSGGQGEIKWQESPDNLEPIFDQLKTWLHKGCSRKSNSEEVDLILQNMITRPGCGLAPCPRVECVLMVGDRSWC